MTTTHLHAMPFGAELRSDGTRFSLWAPGAQQVELELQQRTAAAARLPLLRQPGGWHELLVPGVCAGARYRYVIDGTAPVPDPGSRRNPDGVHGASEVVDAGAHRWRDGHWRGRPWREAVVCELHVGTFTPQGTFAAAAQRLVDLADTGFTAVELMPLAAFPGSRGWGYDGVLPFAPHAGYGTPDDLKAFVDAAHATGLMVLLDVVYNHFGPEGNYLHGWCPQFFSTARQTPWGAALNFDGADSSTVRAFFRHNALYWVEEFHFDGLRLDAVHAMHDTSPQHIVCEIAQALQDGPGRRRHVHLVLENEANEAERLQRRADGRPLCASAQWHDGWHHAAHVLATGESEGYYADFAPAPLQRLALSLAQGLDRELPGEAHVPFLQNHDQIGNRAFGERISALAQAEILDAMYVCLLLSPQVPLLFMGEEFAASTPFLYFCDVGPGLADAVSAGRRAEFAQFKAFADPAARQRIPDPNAAATFERSRLHWNERDAPGHRERLALVRALLALRHQVLLPRLAGGAQRGVVRAGVDALLHVEWPLAGGAVWHVIVNFGAVALPVMLPAGTSVLHRRSASDGDGGVLQLAPAGSVVASTG